MDTKAAGIGIRQLSAEHLVHEGERQLVIRVIDRPGALVLQTGEVVFLKRLDEGYHVLARYLEEVGDAFDIPALIVHPHHCPAGFIGIFEFVEMD